MRSIRNMRIEDYVLLRNNGTPLGSIQRYYDVSKETVDTFELSYQCYLKKISIDDAIKIIKEF